MPPKGRAWNKNLKAFNHNFFEIIDTEAKAYWLGFMMADGCVSMTASPKVTIQLQDSDVEHLYKFQDAIESTIEGRFGYGGIANTCYATITHYSKKMCEDLIKHGCTPKKSLTLEFPTTIPNDLLNNFVRGYFDGDGCAYVYKDRYLRLAFAGTKSFLTQLLIVLKVDFKIRSIPNNKSFAVQLTGNRAKSVRDWLYDNASIYMKRKREVCYPI